MNTGEKAVIPVTVTVQKDDVLDWGAEYLGKEIATEVESTVASYEIKRKMIPELVKEMVYAHKDEIVEQITDRAVRELCKKALPKLLERAASDA